MIMMRNKKFYSVEAALLGSSQTYLKFYLEIQSTCLLGERELALLGDQKKKKFVIHVKLSSSLAVMAVMEKLFIPQVLFPNHFYPS